MITTKEQLLELLKNNVVLYEKGGYIQIENFEDFIANVVCNPKKNYALVLRKPARLEKATKDRIELFKTRLDSTMLSLFLDCGIVCLSHNLDKLITINEDLLLEENTKYKFFDCKILVEKIKKTLDLL